MEDDLYNRGAVRRKNAWSVSSTPDPPMMTVTNTVEDARNSTSHPSYDENETPVFPCYNHRRSARSRLPPLTATWCIEEVPDPPNSSAENPEFITAPSSVMSNFDESVPKVRGQLVSGWSISEGPETEESVHSSLTSETATPLSSNPAKSRSLRFRASSTMLSVTPPYTPSPSPAPGGLTSRPSSSVSIGLRQRVRTFKKSFDRRSEDVRSIIARPPTPEDDELPEDIDIDPETLKVEDFVPDLESPLTEQTSQEDRESSWVSFQKRTISTTSKTYILWISIVSATFIYNAFCVPFRASYPYQTPENLWLWLIGDYICDFVYWVDMTIIKPKIRFMKGGLEVSDYAQTKKHYFMSSTFKLDLVCNIPIDLLYVVPGLRFNSLLRFNRIFKHQSYMELHKFLDSRLSNPYILRVGYNLMNMIFLIHCNSCIFYKLSEWQHPYPENGFIYHLGRGHAYIHSFHYATKHAISVGNSPIPTNVPEYIYATIAWMMGVFLFAILLGSIRDIVRNATKTKDSYRMKMDATLDHLKKLNVADGTLDKVRLWFVHNWEHQGTFNELLLIEKLPKKLQADLAMSAHFKTLGKLKLFQGCDRGLLRELVLKLKPVLFLPGDYVCRKAEVGKEMYIVSSGILDVVGGPNGDIVFATLQAGSVFGEISLLGQRGKNRRTADVRSKGFSILFVLSKFDLDDTIRDYPEAQVLLKKKARRLMKENEKRNKKSVSTKEKLEEAVLLKRTPRMADAVLKMLKPESSVAQKLREKEHQDITNTYERYQKKSIHLQKLQIT